MRPLGPDLRDVEQVVHEPYEFCGDRVRFAPQDPLEVPTLAARAAAHPGRVAVVEARWVGDAVHDWFVRRLPGRVRGALVDVGHRLVEHGPDVLLPGGVVDVGRLRRGHRRPRRSRDGGTRDGDRPSDAQRDDRRARLDRRHLGDLRRGRRKALTTPRAAEGIGT
ncbi:hypothetical protein [Streptomyces kaempferi]|uniref:Uncharacterized protein n=1 Tax=Streptomyces kaempferi TaxID=333725 RepID=A0ABW3XT23_9ACTN